MRMSADDRIRLSHLLLISNTNAPYSSKSNSTGLYKSRQICRRQICRGSSAAYTFYGQCVTRKCLTSYKKIRYLEHVGQDHDVQHWQCHHWRANTRLLLYFTQHLLVKIATWKSYIHIPTYTYLHSKRQASWLRQIVDWPNKNGSDWSLRKISFLNINMTKSPLPMFTWWDNILDYAKLYMLKVIYSFRNPQHNSINMSVAIYNFIYIYIYIYIYTNHQVFSYSCLPPIRPWIEFNLNYIIMLLKILEILICIFLNSIQ